MSVAARLQEPKPNDNRRHPLRVATNGCALHSNITGFATKHSSGPCHLPSCCASRMWFATGTRAVTFSIPQTCSKSQRHQDHPPLINSNINPLCRTIALTSSAQHNIGKILVWLRIENRQGASGVLFVQTFPTSSINSQRRSRPPTSSKPTNTNTFASSHSKPAHQRPFSNIATQNTTIPSQRIHTSKEPRHTAAIPPTLKHTF